MKTCFLIGHRDAPFVIREKLEKAITAAIAEYGVTEFVVGHNGAFDKMAASCLSICPPNAKNDRFPEIGKRSFCLPGLLGKSLKPSCAVRHSCAIFA